MPMRPKTENGPNSFAARFPAPLHAQTVQFPVRLICSNFTKAAISFTSEAIPFSYEAFWRQYSTRLFDTHRVAHVFYTVFLQLRLFQNEKIEILNGVHLKNRSCRPFKRPFRK